MSDLQWRNQVPTRQGWYWVKYPDNRISMWFFDCSDYDVNELNKADRFYGPLEPPEPPPDD